MSMVVGLPVAKASILFARLGRFGSDKICNQSRRRRPPRPNLSPSRDTSPFSRQCPLLMRSSVPPVSAPATSVLRPGILTTAQVRLVYAGQSLACSPSSMLMTTSSCSWKRFRFVCWNGREVELGDDCSIGGSSIFFLSYAIASAGRLVFSSVPSSAVSESSLGHMGRTIFFRCCSKGSHPHIPKSAPNSSPVHVRSDMSIAAQP